jgi:hypothetical protein
MTMSNALERLRDSEKALDAERRLMKVALAGLRKAEAQGIARRAGRLIFGLDLTGSREPGLKRARIATAAMFDAIRTFGSVEVKLVYYRGTSECRETHWCADPDVLRRSMLKLSCERGLTQIERLLRAVLAEKERLSGVVFIGDHCEESGDRLVGLARQLGERSIPLFMFHECDDHNLDSLLAKPVFKAMAEASGGVYVEFKPDSGEVLRELLPAVAAFSAAGVAGLNQIALPQTSEARQLQGTLRLMLGNGGSK